MKNPFLYLVFVLFFCTCSKRYSKKTEVSDFIPQSFETVLKINSLSEFKTLSNLNTPFNDNTTDAILNIYEHIEPKYPLYIVNTDSSYYLFTKYHDELLKSDAPSTPINTSYTSDIVITSNAHGTIYHKVIDSVFMTSTDLKLIKGIEKNENLQLQNVISTSNNKAVASIIYNTTDETPVLLNKLNARSSSSYHILDVAMDKDDIIFNGISVSNDSLYFINTFKNTRPQQFKLAEIIPNDVTSVTRIGYNDFGALLNNLKELNEISTDSISEFIEFSNEAALIETNISDAIVIGALDGNLLKESLESQTIEETFKGIPIFKYDQQNTFKHIFSPFISVDNVSFFFSYETFVVFSNDIETLQNIITNKLNNQVLSNFDKFNAISNQLSNESSYLVYKNKKGLEDFLSGDSHGYNANAVQYVYDSDFAHINGVFSKYKKRQNTNTITEDFSVQIPSDILSSPQTVTNHRNGTKEIMVQDINNVVYLISNSGKILWKKQLNGAILGKIEQIDIYKNKRLQLAFATPNRVYVIDRNGKDVGPFPLKFNDAITQPLSVFDYDNRKNYRLLVTQGRSLLMYDAKAKRVNGFRYSNAQNTISSQPKHFRIASKDYIVFSHGEKLEILNRQGQERIKVQGDISFSNNSIFKYKNTFTTLNKNGALVQVDTRGRISNKNIGLEGDSKLNTTSKTLVALDENRLKIKSNIIDLDFGNYTDPNLFYLNDKIYVSVTDLQSKKVFLYDSQSKPIKNFPVFGVASAELVDLDNKKKLKLITQTDSKTILVYNLN
ncbi:MAG: hypothetical protein ED556_00020 [Winogradskyella sp.]|uniref:hypothetical protein n=1 Tax=Winogradskyella sp. TaxID=1883156 RepID=UPI000F3BF7AC|nr:hypothetical protein [Winogradskyella sp.]RNC87616.1 MAG: hypothetical protein ED556_00020 [Winogradskyella sp.]